MSKKYIDLKEQNVKDITATFNEVADGISKELGTMIDSLSSFCAEAKYEVINNVAKEAEQLVNESIKEIETRTRNWANEYGFRVNIKVMEAGSNAEQTAGKLDDAIITAISNAKPKQVLNISSDTSSPYLDDAYIDKFSKIFSDCEKKLTTITENANKKIKSKSNDDVTFGVVIAPVTILSETIKNLMAGLAKKGDDFKREMTAKNSKISQASNSSANRGKKESMNAKSKAKVLKLFHDKNTNA